MLFSKPFCGFYQPAKFPSKQTFDSTACEGVSWYPTLVLRLGTPDTITTFLTADIVSQKIKKAHHLKAVNTDLLTILWSPVYVHGHIRAVLLQACIASIRLSVLCGWWNMQVVLWWSNTLVVVLPWWWLVLQKSNIVCLILHLYDLLHSTWAPHGTGAHNIYSVDIASGLAKSTEQIMNLYKWDICKFSKYFPGNVFLLLQ